MDAMADVKLDEDGELRIFEIEAVMEVCAVVYGEEQADDAGRYVFVKRAGHTGKRRR